MAWTYRVVHHGHYVALHTAEVGTDGAVKRIGERPIDFAFDVEDGVNRLIQELVRACLEAMDAAVIYHQLDGEAEAMPSGGTSGDDISARTKKAVARLIIDLHGQPH